MATKTKKPITPEDLAAIAEENENLKAAVADLIQERDEAIAMNNESSPNIHQRMKQAIIACRGLKEETKSSIPWPYFSHDQVTSVVRMPLLEAGIYGAPHAATIETLDLDNKRVRAEMQLIYRFTNVDDQNDYIDVPGFGHGIDSSDKAPGKAYSYAVKYALMKGLMLETGDENESEISNPDGSGGAPEKEKRLSADQANKRKLKQQIGVHLSKARKPEDIDAIWAEKCIPILAICPPEFTLAAEQHRESLRQKIIVEADKAQKQETSNTLEGDSLPEAYEPEEGDIGQNNTN